jgi:hypothetical protein
MRNDILPMKKFTIVIHSEDPEAVIKIRESLDDLIERDWQGEDKTTIIMMEDYSNAPSRVVARYKT